MDSALSVKKNAIEVTILSSMESQPVPIVTVQIRIDVPLREILALEL